MNQEANPIEVIYSFPVEESAAIIGFEASINGHVIVAQVKEKEKAKAEYQQAMEVKNTSVNFIQRRDKIRQNSQSELRSRSSNCPTLISLPK